MHYVKTLADSGLNFINISVHNENYHKIDKALIADGFTSADYMKSTGLWFLSEEEYTLFVLRWS